MLSQSTALTPGFNTGSRSLGQGGELLQQETLESQTATKILYVHLLGTVSCL